jgi:hypothetical protein
MSEWIAASERLPEPGSKVLVWAAGDVPTCYTAHHGYLVEWFVNTDYSSTGHRYTITHWKPLPKPPNEEPAQ